MRVCRFNEGRFGLIQKDEVVDVTSVLDALAGAALAVSDA